MAQTPHTEELDQHLKDVVSALHGAEGGAHPRQGSPVGERGMARPPPSPPLRAPDPCVISREEERKPRIRRIESESEPPNLATEKNAGCGIIRARSPQSPVRVRDGHTPKPREDTGFWGPLAFRRHRLR